MNRTFNFDALVTILGLAILMFVIVPGIGFLLNYFMTGSFLFDGVIAEGIHFWIVQYGINYIMGSVVAIITITLLRVGLVVFEAVFPEKIPSHSGESDKQ